MQKFCPNCGVKIPEGIKFCPECGVNIESFSLRAETDTTAHNINTEPRSPINVQSADCSFNLKENTRPAIINHGSAIEKTPEKTVLSRKVILAGGIVLLLVIIAVGSFFAYPMVVTQPEDVVFHTFQLMKNGEYAKSLEMVVDEQEMALTPEDKREIVEWLVSNDYANNDAVKSETLTLISSKKIDETHYLVTYNDSWVNTRFGPALDRSMINDINVVKQDGQWKMVGIGWDFVNMTKESY